MCYTAAAVTFTSHVEPVDGLDVLRETGDLIFLFPALKAAGRATVDAAIALLCAWPVIRVLHPGNCLVTR